MTKKKAKHVAKKKNPVKQKPRARRLPGMEDAGIEELETLAQDMADTIASKKETMASEKALNEQLIAAMKKHGRTSYSHAGIHINLTSSEKAKVVIKDEDVDDTPADNEPAPEAKVSPGSMVENSEA